MKILAPFPYNGGVKIKTVGQASPSKALIGYVVLFLAIIGAGFWQKAVIDDILKDREIAQGYHAVDAYIDEQKSGCRNRVIILTDCTVYMRFNGQDIKKNFSFFDFTGEKNFTVQPIAANHNSQLISIDLAVERVNNRILFSAAVIMLFLGLLAFLAYQAVNFMPKIRKILNTLNQDNEQPWRLVALQMDDGMKKYRTTLGGADVQIPFNFGKKNAPWLIEGKSGQIYLVGVAAKTGELAAPLDENLKVVGGISKQEKNNLKEKISHLLAQKQNEI